MITLFQAVALVLLVVYVYYWGVASDSPRERCLAMGVRTANSVPFDEAVGQAMAAGRPVTDARPDSPASLALGFLWEEVRDLLDGGRSTG